jgi:Fe-S cluster biogenesis protein NfuA
MAEINIQETPNPLSLKFLLDVPVIPLDLTPVRTFFVKNDIVVGCPFAKEVLAIEHIQAAFLGRNFVTISKTMPGDWFVLKPQIVALLEKYTVIGFFERAAPQFDETFSRTFDDNGISAQIMELINTRVRPAVLQDGGDIIFDRFDNGTVYVRMQGACVGCPSSTATLKTGIERMLKYFVPEVQSVEQMI